MEQTKKITYFPFSGPALLDMSLLNKGNAFTKEERKQFNLEGLLPYNIETIEDQVKRVHQRLHSQPSDLEKHVYLRALQDTNETLFYRLIVENFSEILPLIYTPTVGQACEKFSQIYRERRGLFLSYPDKGSILDHVWNVTRKNVKVIVLTDGERILGLGDLGTGGMGIPIGKLSLYTAGGGISPAYTLPIYVDVGTNNEELLADEMYIGWRHKRVDDEDYYAFLEEVVTALDKRWPGVLIQFEDFAQKHAFPLLQKYKGRFCSFNDDIQGTAAITLASLIAAAQKGGVSLAKEKIIFAGAGSAASGIADLIVRYKMQFGISQQEAAASIFLHNSKGLVCAASQNLYDYQRPYVKPAELYASWNKTGPCPSLMDTVRNSGAGVLLGLSAQKGLFTQEMVEQMAKNRENPVIFPLSNPTSKAEAVPKDLIDWTKGKAIVATGSPFPQYQFEGKNFTFSQCNNCYIFPGIGLAAISSKTTRISDTMILKAAEALANYAAEKKSRDILPPLEEVPTISRKIAFDVIKQAIQEGYVLPMDDEQILKRIERNYWMPEYREYRRTSF